MWGGGSLGLPSHAFLTLTTVPAHIVLTYPGVKRALKAWGMTNESHIYLTLCDR